MTLVAYTGWCCLNCGHRTDRGFAIKSCCSAPLPARALINVPDITDAERAELAAARAGAVEEPIS